MPCLTSLLEQDYLHYEILMLDDNSEDAIRRCAEAIASRLSGHLRIISGATLPEGWTGKSWACHQLAWEAMGSFLLFTDADTVQEPAMLEAAMAFALHQKVSLLSVWPRQVTHSLGEKSVNTLFYLLGIGFFPHLLFWPLSARSVWLH